MKHTSLILTGCALLLAVTGNAQAKKKPVAKKPVTHSKTTAGGSAGYTKAGNSLEYKMITRGKGLVTAKLGDVVELNIKQRIDDSLMLNTMVANQGKPVEVQIQASPIKGDLMEGLVLLKAGDSAVFRIRLDTLAHRANQPMPEWAAKNAYVIWDVKLLKIKTKEEVTAEQAKAKAEAMGRGQKQAAADEKLIQEYLQKNNITNAKRTASGLYYVIRKEGEGASPATGQKVTMNYTGMTLNGEKFDSNEDPAFNHVEPFDFPLGQRNVIAGWDEGVALLKKGTKATLYIPSAMAYGERGAGPKIPPNSVLIFDVEVVNFQ